MPGAAHARSLTREPIRSNWCNRSRTVRAANILDDRWRPALLWINAPDRQYCAPSPGGRYNRAGRSGSLDRSRDELREPGDRAPVTDKRPAPTWVDSHRLMAESAA